MTRLNSCKCERQAVLAFMQENIQSHARARLTLHINNVTDPARLILEDRIVLIDCSRLHLLHLSLCSQKNPDPLTHERRIQKSTAPETNERGNRCWLQKNPLLHPLISFCLSLRLTLDLLLTSWPPAPAEKSPPAIRLPCPLCAAAAQCQSLSLPLSCTRLRASSHSQHQGNPTPRWWTHHASSLLYFICLKGAFTWKNILGSKKEHLCRYKI